MNVVIPGPMGGWRVELRILAAPAEQQAMLDLPWDMPLEEWPEWYLISLPRGISRHVVRFTRLNGRVYALKEVVESYAEREYRLLRPRAARRSRSRRGRHRQRAAGARR